MVNNHKLKYTDVGNMKLEAGRRVYVPSTKTFGTVVRHGGVLGLSKSYAIVDDLGKKTVFIGDDIEFVYVDSSEKMSGEKVDIPQDVVPTIIKDNSPMEARKMTLDLYDLCPEERSEACDKIMGSKSKKTSAKKTSAKKTSSKKASSKKASARRKTVGESK